jgi:CHAT domain-containing protein/Tfp pilus assembly protein PilF
MRQYIIYIGLCFFLNIQLKAQSLILADTTEANRLLKESADLQTKYKFSEALLKADSAITIVLNISKKETLLLADALQQKVRCQLGLGKHNEAIALNDTVFAIKSSILGENHHDVAAIYNDLGRCYQAMRKYDEGIAYYQKALKILTKTVGVNHLSSAWCYYNIGLSYYFKNEYENAINHHIKAVEIRAQILGKDHLDVAQSYNDLSAFYSQKGLFQKAIEYSEKALLIRIKKLGKVHLDVASSYNNIGSFYNSKGDFDKAITYHSQALAIRVKILGTFHVAVAASYSNLGNVYISKEDFEKALDYHQKALVINLKGYDSLHQRVLQNYNNLGIAYLGKKDFVEATRCYDKALDGRIKVFGANSLDVAGSYNNLGEYYYQKRDYTQSLAFHQKSLAIRLKILGKINPEVSMSYRNMGYAALALKQYDEADLYYEQALAALSYKTVGDLPKVNSMINLLNALNGIAKFEGLLYQKTKDKDYLDQALNTYQEALTTTNYYNKTLNTEGSRIDLKKQTYDIYEGVIKTSLSLSSVDTNKNYLSNAFDYNEQSKARLLQAQIREAEALKYANIPDNLVQKEYDLRVDLTWLNKQLQGKMNGGKSETDSTVLALSSKLFDEQQQYDTLKMFLEKNYPEYYRLKYDVSTIPLSMVEQKLLSPDQTLLSYFMGDSSVFIFVVNKNDYKVYTMPKDSLDEWVKQWRFSIYDNRDAIGTAYEQNAQQFSYLGNKLYEKLIAPVKNQLKPHLIIIPDGVLGYIPFEALLVEKPAKDFGRFQLHHYLLKDYTISYNYSVTLWQEMKNREFNGRLATHIREANLIAFAPTFGKDTLKGTLDTILDISKRSNPLTRLIHNVPEVQAIQRIMGGKIYTGKYATKQAFLKEAPQYRIIHLATHGKADDRLGDYAFLSFQEDHDSLDNERLYVKDLYNCAFNADMVVLSACETGIGKWQRGEGIISLARAFAYAGTKSIVTTLWGIDDVSTKILMEYFYSYLKKGLAKDAALRQAKLDFLKQMKADDATPLKWAGIIAIGDM